MMCTCNAEFSVEFEKLLNTDVHFQDYIALRGEVYFPNLEFEKTTLNFGCILNDTEVTRYVNITNNSPMQVCVEHIAD